MFESDGWNVIDHIKLLVHILMQIDGFTEILCLQKLIDCNATKRSIFKNRPIITCHICSSSNLLLKFCIKNIQPIVHNNGLKTGENIWTHCTNMLNCSFYLKSSSQTRISGNSVDRRQDIIIYQQQTSQIQPIMYFVLGHSENAFIRIS